MTSDREVRAGAVPAVLCVDDDEEVLRRLRRQLAGGLGGPCRIHTARSAEEALDLVMGMPDAEDALAVVIADQRMPGRSGTGLLKVLHAHLPDLRSILLTGAGDLEAIAEAVNDGGLNRYIRKPWEEHDLRLAVDGLLAQFQLRRENQRLIADLEKRNRALEEANRLLEVRVAERTAELVAANERLGRLATIDAMTGLHNFRHFRERLDEELDRARRSGSALALLILDVDHFKAYNDRFGHPAGDELLRQLASVLSSQRRTTDLVARYGGEEFVFVAADCPAVVAPRIAERVRRVVASTPFRHPGEGPHPAITVSIGVATVPTDAKDAESLVRSADLALYRAKKEGRNRVALAG